MKNVLLLISCCATLLLSGCDNNDLFQSEKKLNSKIQNSWRVIYAYQAGESQKEVWSFQGGTVKITRHLNSGNDSTVVGSYKVDARLTKAYVKLSDFKFTEYLNSGFLAADLNRSWTIVELSGGVMYLSTKDSNGNIRSLEFTQQ